MRGKLGVLGAKRAQSERAVPRTRAPELAVSPSTAMEPPTPRPMSAVIKDIVPATRRAARGECTDITMLFAWTRPKGRC